ncbi:MAG: PKD domain-containing protein [Bacteroidetes bacterium]|nr:PKD domain-containing protein [Bacteroidota bacterium]
MYYIRSLFFSSILVFATCVWTKAQTPDMCGTDIERKKLIESHPEILQREANFDKLAAARLTSIMRIEDETLIIPVVFHIIHDYGSENISDAQVIDAMENINADFRGTNVDFLATLPEYADIAADLNIEFRLAQRELSGGCTNGIDRIASLRTYEGSDAAKLGGWQSGKYLNIWVTKDLTSGAAAYAYYPTSIAGLMYTVDGIIARHDYVGTIGTAGSYAIHVLSHEIGHYLNLQHVWGNSNAPGVACGDDQVPDTPMTEGWTSCNIYGNTCGGAVDNVQNHMEYSYCSTMFTEGQKARVYAALESEDAMRNNLYTPGNLALTGTADGYVASGCVPKADFYASDRILCNGNSTTFHDVSFNAPVVSRLWEFEGGVPATSTELNPIVNYSTEGWHTVKLTVTNENGSNTKIFENYLNVSKSDAIYDATYFADFNDETSTKKDWIFYNKYPDDREWKWRSSNGYWNSGCVWLNSRYGPDLETDIIISPAFDLALNLTDNVFFKYATTSYGVGEVDYTMSLKIYYSINCGDTWVYMNKLTGAELISSYGGSSDFYPQYPDQWASAVFNLPESAKTNHVQFKFEFVYNPYVNNIFIDDFNFTTGVLSTPAPEAFITLKMSPNPVSAKNTAALYYNVVEQCAITLEITDIYGKLLHTKNIGITEPGSHQEFISPADWGLQSGCYFIRLKSGQYDAVSRLIVD